VIRNEGAAASVTDGFTWYAAPYLWSDGSAWGVGDDDNVDADVLLGDAAYQFGKDATFSCGYTTCTP
jgi:hypothetical protein